MEKITDDKTQPEPQMTEEEKKLMQEWETHMSDFVPEDITTVELDGRAEMVTATLRNPSRPSTRTWASSRSTSGAPTS